MASQRQTSASTPGAVYKILQRTKWQAALRDGIFHGSCDDLRDGFIHLSTADQLAGTIAKHFHGRTDLVLVALDSGRLGSGLVWERSRGGELFPHLYGALDPSTAIGAVQLELDQDGVVKLPEDPA